MTAHPRSQTPVTRLAMLGLTLYLSRALAELGARMAWPWLAILGGLAGLGIGYALGRVMGKATAPRPRTPHADSLHYQTLPALLLWAYVLYPAFDLRVAGLVGLAAALTGLIARYPRPAPHLLDGGVFVAALAIYWLTLAPGLLPADAGEFQLVAARLGIAHQPGYPLYTMLGKLFTLLTPHNPMRGLNLFSAVTAALTVMLAGRAARKLSGSAWAGLAASFTLAFAASFWSTATQASIRPLMAFFTALCIERLAAWREGLHARPVALALRPVHGFALALGLGLTHHPSLAFPGVFFAVTLLLIDPALLRQPRRWPALVGAFALGFLPWLYLPLRGAMNAPLAPGDIGTWPGFWRHVLARGFEGDLFTFHTPVELADRMRVLGNILALQWNPVILIGAALAGIMLLRRDWRAFVLLGGSGALHSLITMTYRAPQTVEYLIPAYVALAVMVGAGVGRIMQEGVSDTAPGAQEAVSPQGAVCSGWGLKACAITTAVVLAAAVALLVRNWPSFVALAQDDSTRVYAEAIFEQAPPDAVVLANWHWATPLMALQHIEGQRPDVEVIYVYPEGAEPLAQTWVRRIEMSIGQRPVVVTGFYPPEFGAMAAFFEPLGPAWLVRESPRRDLPPGMTPRELETTGGVTLLGYALPAEGETRVGETFEVLVAWRVDEPQDYDVTTFVHLYNSHGVWLSGSDQPLPTHRADVGDVLITRHTLGMSPYNLPSPLDTYFLYTGLYATTPEGFRISYTFYGRFGAIDLGAITFEPLDWPAPTAHPRHMVFANGARLTGYDWEGDVVYLHSAQPDGTPRLIRASGEGVEQVIRGQIGAGAQRLGPWGVPLGRSACIPGARPGEQYVPLGEELVLSRVTARPTDSLAPGQEVIVDLELLSTRPLLVDDVVKVDVIGEGWAWRAQSDHIPATGAIPTLKWLWGWRVVDRHRLSVPPDASTTTAQAEMLVYDHFTGRVLPLLDFGLAEQGITVPIYAWP